MGVADNEFVTTTLVDIITRISSNQEETIFLLIVALPSGVMVKRHGEVQKGAIRRFFFLSLLMVGRRSAARPPATRNGLWTA